MASYSLFTDLPGVASLLLGVCESPDCPLDPLWLHLSLEGCGFLITWWVQAAAFHEVSTVTAKVAKHLPPEDFSYPIVVQLRGAFYTPVEFKG